MVEARDLDAVVVDRQAVRAERRLQQRHVRQIEKRGAVDGRIVRQRFADPRPQRVARLARRARARSGRDRSGGSRSARSCRACPSCESAPDRREVRSPGAGRGTPPAAAPREAAAAWSKPGSGAWNEATMTKIASPFCRATTRRVVKLRPSRSRSTSNRIGSCGIAAEQEIGVQRVGVAAGDRALRGDQRLRQHLSAEHPPPAVARRMADEPILARRREVEQSDEFVSGHGLCIRLADRSRRLGPRASTWTRPRKGIVRRHGEGGRRRSSAGHRSMPRQLLGLEWKRRIPEEDSMRRFVLSLVILVGAGSAGHGQDNWRFAGFSAPRSRPPARFAGSMAPPAAARPADSSVYGHRAGLWDLGAWSGRFAPRLGRIRARRCRKACDRVRFPAGRDMGAPSSTAVPRLSIRAIIASCSIQTSKLQQTAGTASGGGGKRFKSCRARSRIFDRASRRFAAEAAGYGSVGARAISFAFKCTAPKTAPFLA